MSAPSNGTCSSAIDVSSLLPYSLTLDTTAGSTDSEAIPLCDAFGGKKAVWWKYTNSGSVYKLVTINTTGSNYAQVLSVWIGGCGSLTQIECYNDPYSGTNYLVTFAAAPGTSYWIEIADLSGSDTGGSLVLNITALTLPTGTPAVIANDTFSTYEQFVTAFDVATDAEIARDTSFRASVSTISGLNPVTAAAVRPDSTIFTAIKGVPSGGPVNSATIFVLSPSMGVISHSYISIPDTILTGGWEPWGAAYDSSGYLYLAWVGNTNFGCCIQRRINSTFALVDEQKAFDAGSSGGGGVLAGGIGVSPDGTKVYYHWTSGTNSHKNEIRSINLSTGVVASFAVYSSPSWGPTTTGYRIPAYSLKVDSNGNVYVIVHHLTANVLDQIHIVKYNSAGSIVWDYTVLASNTDVFQSLGISSDAAYAWIASYPTRALYKFQLSDGSLILTTTGLSTTTFGDFLTIGEPTPTPPPSAIGAIYKLVNGSLKTNDTYYTSLSTYAVVSMKIPQPLIQTGFIGDE